MTPPWNKSLPSEVVPLVGYYPTKSKTFALVVALTNTRQKIVRPFHREEGNLLLNHLLKLMIVLNQKVINPALALMPDAAALINVILQFLGLVPDHVLTSTNPQKTRLAKRLSLLLLTPL